MSRFETQYKNLLAQVIVNGEHRPSRVGFTVSTFGTMLKIECLEQGLFPILTQRRIYPKGVLGELAAFLRGATLVQEFKDLGCNYWDANAAKWGPNVGLHPEDHAVGKVYGAQWRNWTDSLSTLDQLQELKRGLRADPYGRRHLLTTYNPAELTEGCLPPCHLLAQFNVRTTQQLDCIVTMRSVDLCLGLPSDIILYATLMLLLCNETGYTPGSLTFMMGDSHVYRNHIDMAQVQLCRPMHELPSFSLRRQATLDNFMPSDLTLTNYNHAGPISYELNT